MFTTIIVLLPVYLCFFWVLFHFSFATRIPTFNDVAWLLATSGVMIFAEGSYTFLHETTRSAMGAALLSQLSTPALAPLCGMYLRKLRFGGHTNRFMLLWIAIPVAMFSAAAVFQFLAKPGEISAYSKMVQGVSRISDLPLKGSIAYFHYIFTEHIYRIVHILEVLWLAWYIIHIARGEHFRVRHMWDYLFRGKKISVLEMQCFIITLVSLSFILKMFVFRQNANTHPAAMIFLAVLQTMAIGSFAYVALFSSVKSITLRDIFHGWRYNFAPENRAAEEELMIYDLMQGADEDTLRRIDVKICRRLDIDDMQLISDDQESPLESHVLSVDVPDNDENGMLARFQKLMIDDKVFLQPRLTLTDVSDMLDSNKTYVSRMVNEVYKMGFPELINTFRVDYAKQYISTHRVAKQTEIAEQCGFLSASSFNNTFKKISGVTPKVWLASRERLENR